MTIEVLKFLGLYDVGWSKKLVSHDAPVQDKVDSYKYGYGFYEDTYRIVDISITPDGFWIYVKTLFKTLPFIECDPSDTIESLKAKVEKMEGIP